MAVLWLLTRAAVKLSLFQDSDLSYSMPRRVKCRTKAASHLSRSLETCNIPKIILSKLKFIKNIRINEIIPNSVSSSTWLCVTPRRDVWAIGPLRHTNANLFTMILHNSENNKSNQFLISLLVCSNCFIVRDIQ